MLKFIAGPCVIESQSIAFQIAECIKGLSERYPVEFIFKASFDKANRTSLSSYRGPGIDEGLRILNKIKEQFQLKVLTDIHLPEQADIVAKVVDVIQIPAFLCRQTDLLVAAAKTNKIVNVKKGQFLSPKDMKHVVEKIAAYSKVTPWLCERGNSFGYNNLIVDMRSIHQMKELTHCPVIIDASHSIQLPGSGTNNSLGNPEFIPLMTRSAIAAGADGVFVETHPDPKNALSDGSNSVILTKLESLVIQAIKIFEATKHTETLDV
ncbi:MAG: 3-deoxy-8-phosphooctulonate synthase [Legionellales bacterium]|nr:3-deoxy-8-phosphooctulonate synthase [Legionellales bacterium]